MTERRNDLPDEALDALFSAARDASLPPQPDFVARLLDDAVEEMAAQQAGRLTVPDRAVASRKHEPGPLAGLWSRLGGWMAQGALPGGLAAAAAAGVWIGGWAESSGFLAGVGVADTALALELTYRFPEIAGLLGGY